jgi:hypothetical protein
MNALVPVTTASSFSMGDIARVAEAIAKGGLFGSRDPNAVLTLCLLAHAEGQHPAVVFRDYHIIQGKPAKKADAMLRDFINAGGKVEWHQLDDTKADATFSHPSGSARIDWTLERAKKAQLTTAMWTKYPRQMLRSRVISEGVRTVYPGATSGLYEENEVRDIVAETSSPNPAMEAQDGGVLRGQSEETHSEPQDSATPIEQEPKPRNWGGRYPNKTALRKARVTHHAELERIGVEGTFDDLDGYLTSPEYQDYIKTAGEHHPLWLDGEIPEEMREQLPTEYVQTFRLEQKARDCIAIRGNVAADAEPA